MKKRVQYCDVLRFFAILSVILIHVLADFRDEALLISKPFYFFLTCIDSLTRLGVPIFFMISGIFMLSSKKEESYKDFFCKRVLKLFIPFFIISIVYYINDGIIKGTPINIIDFFNLFSTNMIKYHFWFMYSIIGIYLLIPFLKKWVQALSEKELRYLIIVIFLASSGLSFIDILTTSYFNVSTLKSFILPNIICYINYLFLGYYLTKYHKPSKKDYKVYIIGIIALLLMPVIDFTITEGLRNELMLRSEGALSFLSSMAFFIFVKNNYDKLHIPKVVEDFCSKNVSLVFYIYMLHVLVLETVKRNLLVHISPSIAITKLEFILILFVLTSVITFILSYIIEKIVGLIKKRLLN